MSLRQLDCFLEMMTSAPLFRTPASSPPKFSSSGNLGANLAIEGTIVRDFHPPDLEPVKFTQSTDQKNLLSPTSPNSKNKNN